MRSFRNTILLLPMAAVLAVGCTAHVGYYDSYHNYHRWDDHEAVYYSQWEHDTHRDHRDFNKRSDADKRAYSDWRHSHDDHH